MMWSFLLCPCWHDIVYTPGVHIMVRKCGVLSHADRSNSSCLGALLEQCLYDRTGANVVCGFLAIGVFYSSPGEIPLC